MKVLTTIPLALIVYISAARAAIVAVTVGKDNEFQPEVIQADVGDIVEFLFLPKNHSVTRAE
jgi:plastocyanin